MGLVLHWYLPTGGDGATLLAAGAGAQARRQARRSDREAGGRSATLDHLVAVARAAEQAGFDAVLTPTGTWCEDAWITTAVVSQHVRRLRFLVAFRPGTVTPMLAAQQAVAFQRLTGGRLLLNVVTGGDDAEQRRHGDGLGKDQRYARTDEFLTVLRDAWRGDPVSFRGQHLWTDGAVAFADGPPPPVYFGGASDAAVRVAARHADVYLTWGDRPQAVGAQIRRVREQAAALGRTVRSGVRLHVVTRDREADAWRDAAALLDGADEQTIEAAQLTLRREASEGQRRMLALHGGRRDQLEVHPHLWAGVGLLRGGAGTALVGSHEQVADLIAEYHAAGVDELILSGFPHDVEATVVGRGLLPELRRRGLLDHRHDVPASASDREPTDRALTPSLPVPASR